MNEPLNNEELLRLQNIIMGIWARINKYRTVENWAWVLGITDRIGYRVLNREIYADVEKSRSKFIKFFCGKKWEQKTVDWKENNVCWDKIRNEMPRYEALLAEEVYRESAARETGYKIITLI